MKKDTYSDTWQTLLLMRQIARTLVNELIEGVLSVSSRLTPRYRSCHVVDSAACTCYILTVRLHVALLEVRRKPMHVLHVTQSHRHQSTHRVHSSLSSIYRIYYSAVWSHRGCTIKRKTQEEVAWQRNRRLCHPTTHTSSRRQTSQGQIQLEVTDSQNLWSWSCRSSLINRHRRQGIKSSQKCSIVILSPRFLRY